MITNLNSEDGGSTPSETLVFNHLTTRSNNSGNRYFYTSPWKPRIMIRRYVIVWCVMMKFVSTQKMQRNEKFHWMYLVITI